MAARLVDAAFALVYLRLLGRSEVGAYQFLVVFTTYLDTLIDFGLNALVAREVSRGSVAPGVAFRAVAGLRLGLWLVGLPLVGLVYGLLPHTANLSAEDVLAGAIFYLALLPSVLAKTATALLWAAERLELTAAVSVLATLLRTALGALVLFDGLGLVGLAAASLATNVVTALTLWRLTPGDSAWRAVAVAPQTSEVAPGPPMVAPGPPMVAPGPPMVAPGPPMVAPGPPTVAPGHPWGSLGAGDSRAPIRWLRESWPLFVNQLLQGLFFKVDALLLPGLAGTAAAGVYAAAYKVSEGAGIVSSSFTLALFPRLSRGRDPTDAYRMALRLLLQVALPLAAGTALLAEPIVAIVGGRAYLPDSAVALAILIGYLPLSYANGLTQYLLIAAGRQRLLTAAFVAALVFNVAANLVLIPRFSFVGAAWVTVASELVLLVPFQRAAARVAPGVSLVREAQIPLIATLLMAPVVWWLRDAVHPVAALAGGGVVYTLALWSLGGIDAQQRRLLQQLMQ